MAGEIVTGTRGQRGLAASALLVDERDPSRRITFKVSACKSPPHDRQVEGAVAAVSIVKRTNLACKFRIQLGFTEEPHGTDRYLTRAYGGHVGTRQL